MYDKTVIYLDIDGVINVPVELPGFVSGWPRMTTREVNLRMVYATQLVNRLNALAARPDVEIVFCTSWTDRAYLLEKIGLKCSDWKVMDDRKVPKEWITDEDWKLSCVKYHQHQIGGSRFIWIEDGLELYADGESTDWINAQPNGSWVSTNYFIGITTYQMKVIEAAIDDPLAFALLPSVSNSHTMESLTPIFTKYAREQTKRTDAS